MRESDDILVLDRGRTLCDLLQTDGHRVRWIRDPIAAAASGELQPAPLTVLDIDLGPRDAGIDLCGRLTYLWPETLVVGVTDRGALAPAVAALRSGVSDLLRRPLSLGQVREALARVSRRRTLGSRLRLVPDLGPGDRWTGFVGDSPAMHTLYSQISHAANTHLPVLVMGESGTGKELVARTLHRRSARRSGPFVPLNCAAMPPNLLESALFGHAEGAYTGASSTREGLFTRADGGTLLLDEIGEMPLHTQVKLLRVLQAGVVRPLGSDRERPVDVRIIAATHRDLAQEVASNRFRPDLFYRINGVEVRVPPLRERRDDVLTLAEHFIEEAQKGHTESPVEKLSVSAVRALLRYAWPGNVRELQNVVRRCVALCRGREIELGDLPRHLTRPPTTTQHWDPGRPLSAPPLRDVRRSYIHMVLETTGSNQTRAGQILGISRRTLYRHLKRAEEQPK